jgi:hypothetical protein
LLKLHLLKLRKRTQFFNKSRQNSAGNPPFFLEYIRKLKGEVRLIIKDRTIPLKLLILGAILRRLPYSHKRYQDILDEFKRREAGYLGEKSLDFYFRSLPQEKYMILHDLNLQDGEYNLQIDTLLLTPEIALIISVKNMAGKLIFDTDNEQFTQIYNDKEKGYSYPIAQAERHQRFIKKLLAKNGFPPVPVEYIVVISNPYSNYVITGPNSSKVKLRVCKADVLLNRVETFEKIYPEPHLSTKELRKLCRLLVKLNTPPTSYLLTKFGIQRTDIVPGVQCPFCKSLPMIRKKQKWYCPSCDSYSSDAHINTLKDYFLLIDLKITNKEFREFVQIPSENVAKRLLHLEKLAYYGKNRYRIYYPKDFPW